MTTPLKSYPSSPSSSIDDLKEAASSAVGSVRDTAGDAVDRGHAAISQAGAKAGEVAETAQQQITTFASELTKMTRQNPLAALAAAAFAGTRWWDCLRGADAISAKLETFFLVKVGVVFLGSATSGRLRHRIPRPAPSILGGLSSAMTETLCPGSAGSTSLSDSTDQSGPQWTGVLT